MELSVDHSQNHNKYRDGSLNATNMNTGFGGKQPTVRDTKIVKRDGYLGAGPEGTLQVGQTQTGAFAEGDPAPIASPNAPKADEKKWQDDAKTIPDNAKDGTQKVTAGYIGKAKGLKQLVQERGLWVAGMTDDGFHIQAGRKVYKGHDKNMRKVLSSCLDYKNEMTALQWLARDMGFVAGSSPKCHPECAGEGVEYAIGVIKTDYRKKNDFKAKTMERRLRESIGVLTLEVCRQCQRRANDYMRAYLKLSTTEPSTHGQIEKMKKEQKSHRDSLDFDLAWVKALHGAVA
jgi:hypothetical protein